MDKPNSTENPSFIVSQNKGRTTIRFVDEGLGLGCLALCILFLLAAIGIAILACMDSARFAMDWYLGVAAATLAGSIPLFIYWLIAGTTEQLSIEKGEFEITERGRFQTTRKFMSVFNIEEVVCRDIEDRCHIEFRDDEKELLIRRTFDRADAEELVRTLKHHISGLKARLCFVQVEDEEAREHLERRFAKPKDSNWHQLIIKGDKSDSIEFFRQGKFDFMGLLGMTMVAALYSILPISILMSGWDYLIARYVGFAFAALIMGVYLLFYGPYVLLILLGPFHSTHYQFHDDRIVKTRWLFAFRFVKKFPVKGKVEMLLSESKGWLSEYIPELYYDRALSFQVDGKKLFSWQGLDDKEADWVSTVIEKSKSGFVLITHPNISSNKPASRTTLSQ